MKMTGALAAAVLMLGASLGFTQQQQQGRAQPSEQSDQHPSPGQGKDQQQQDAQAEISQEELKVTEQEMAKRVSDVNKASKLTGMQVRNKSNENVGKVKDLAIDLKSGKIAYAVLSVGGFLGIGDKLIAVPIEALTIEKGADHLLLDVDKQQVQQAAGFNDNAWPNLDAVESGKTIGFTAQTKTNQNTSATGGTGAQSEQIGGRGASQSEPKKPAPQQPIQPRPQPTEEESPAEEPEEVTPQRQP